MSDHDDPQHRVYHQSDADQINLRDEVEDGADGVMVVRMPLASTGEVRNEGDEPLTREELEAMADQINDGGQPAFLDHGASPLGQSRYSAVGKIGEWREAEVESTDAGEDILIADVRMMDPETLPAASGNLRESLATVKSQVERDFSIASSIGWRDDDDMPGGVDLMEGSIVGIPADPRTTSQSAAVSMARTAVENRPDADPEDLVAAFRDVVMGPTDDSQQRDMTDESSSGDDPDDTQDGQDSTDAEEFRETMLEQQEQQTEILQNIAERMDGEDGDDDDDDDDDMEDQSADADDGADGDRTIDVDGEELSEEDIREMQAELNESDPETPGTDGEQSADEDGTEQHDTDPRNLLMGE